MCSIISSRSALPLFFPIFSHVLSFGVTAQVLGARPHTGFTICVHETHAYAHMLELEHIECLSTLTQLR